MTELTAYTNLKEYYIKQVENCDKRIAALNEAKDRSPKIGDFYTLDDNNYIVMNTDKGYRLLNITPGSRYIGTAFSNDSLFGVPAWPFQRLEAKE